MIGRRMMGNNSFRVSWSTVGASNEVIFRNFGAFKVTGTPGVIIQSWDLQESIWKNGKYWECHSPYDHKHWSHIIKDSKWKRKEDFDHQNTHFVDLLLSERLDLRVLRHFYFLIGHPRPNQVWRSLSRFQDMKRNALHLASHIKLINILMYMHTDVRL